MKKEGRKQSFVKKSLLSFLAVVSILIYLGAIFAGYAGWIDPSTWALPSMLALAFMPFFILSVIGMIGWNIYRFDSWIALFSDFVVIILIYPFILVFPMSHAKSASEGERVFSVMSYNSFYCDDTEFDNPARSRTLDYIINSDADIVCLQELYSIDAAGTHGKATTTQLDKIKELYPYRLEPGSRELVMLSHYPLKEIGGDRGELFFQYQVARVDVMGTPVTVINVHLPSFGLSPEERQVINDIKDGGEGLSHARSEQKSIYSKLSTAFSVRARAARVIRNICDTITGDLIVCGDFNDVPGSFAYRTVLGNDLHDVYKETEMGYTNTFHAYMMYFHIDQMFYRGNMRALDFIRGNVRSSDHYPITGIFALPSD